MKEGHEPLVTFFPPCITCWVTHCDQDSEMWTFSTMKSHATLISRYQCFNFIFYLLIFLTPNKAKIILVPSTKLLRGHLAWQGLENINQWREHHHFMNSNLIVQNRWQKKPTFQTWWPPDVLICEGNLLGKKCMHYFISLRGKELHRKNAEHGNVGCTYKYMEVAHTSIYFGNGLWFHSIWPVWLKLSSRLQD